MVARPEQQLHRAVAEFLSVALGGSAWWTTIGHGSHGGSDPAFRRQGAILKSLGAKSGVPDVMLIDGGRPIFLELKAPKGVVSDTQKECHAALGRAGAIVAVCRSLDEVIDYLREHGVPLRIARGEAASTEEEKALGKDSVLDAEPRVPRNSAVAR